MVSNGSNGSIAITLTGNPISTNTIYRSGGRRTYMTRKGKERKEAYQLEAKSQYQGVPFAALLEVRIKLYFKDARRRDWDNFNKLIMDACNGIVWRDDSQIKIARVEMLQDKENPRTELCILRLG